MNIEISPNEYWKYLNPADGKLYCSMVVIDDKNDWRPMGLMEKFENIDYLNNNRDKNSSVLLSLSIPVRDL
jgi:hypothetical protein